MMPKNPLSRWFLYGTTSSCFSFLTVKIIPGKYHCDLVVGKDFLNKVHKVQSTSKKKKKNQGYVWLYMLFTAQLQGDHLPRS